MVKLGSWGQTIGFHVGIQGQYGLGGLILVLVWPSNGPLNRLDDERVGPKS